MKRVDSRAIIRVRTAEERLRRHLHGENGATFSKGKYMTIGGRVMGTVTTFWNKDNLVVEIYDT